MIFDQTIIVIRPLVTVDRYNNEILDWDAASRTVVHGVSMQPAAQAEDITSEARTMLTTGWRLHTRGELDLRSSDRVEYDGVELDVVGEVARWPHPIHPNRLHHIEAFLERRRG